MCPGGGCPGQQLQRDEAPALGGVLDVHQAEDRAATRIKGEKNLFALAETLLFPEKAR